jgi:hypothetical protein
MKSQEYESIRPYLLGLIQQNEQLQIEERLLTDNEFYEELLIAEDDLIDEYLAGELSTLDRRNFEEHFLVTPERERKVRFGRALNKYTADKARQSAPTPQWWSYPAAFLSARNAVASLALAAAVLLLVFGVSWLAVKNPPQQTPGGPASASIVTAVLTPGMAREGGEITRISVTPDKDTIQLRLALPSGDYEKYHVAILTSQGTNVWTGTSLQSERLPEGKFIVLNLPANIFRRDDYQAKLSGQLANSSFEDAASYTFRVSR